MSAGDARGLSGCPLADAEALGHRLARARTTRDRDPDPVRAALEARHGQLDSTTRAHPRLPSDAYPPAATLALDGDAHGRGPGDRDGELRRALAGALLDPGRHTRDLRRLRSGDRGRAAVRLRPVDRRAHVVDPRLAVAVRV